MNFFWFYNKLFEIGDLVPTFTDLIIWIRVILILHMNTYCLFTLKFNVYRKYLFAHFKKLAI